MWDRITEKPKLRTAMINGFIRGTTRRKPDLLTSSSFKAWHFMFCCLYRIIKAKRRCLD